jgi:DNA polymerase
MPYLFIDTETYHETLSLPTHGTRRYVPGCELMLLGFAEDDDAPAQIWDRTRLDPMPRGLRDKLVSPESDYILIAHNVAFEREVLEHTFEREIPTERWRCSMAKSLAHGYPAALGQVGEALGLSDDLAKIVDGRRLVHKFCKPAPENHKVERYDRLNSPEDWQKFIEYCLRDVEAMREIWRRLPELNYPAHLDEREYWYLDQKINRRGFPLDVQLAEAVQRAERREKRRLAAAIELLTEGTIKSANQRDAVLAYLADLGVELETLDKANVAAALEGDIPERAREILDNRVRSSKASVSKFKKMSAIEVGSRAYYTLQYCGAARTGRWAGRGLQPHNFKRTPPGVTDNDIALWIDAFLADAIDLIHPDPMDAASICLRGTIAAGPGRALTAADYANIEGRILAWLCGEAWKIKAYEDYDAGIGPDTYKVAYSESFDLPVGEVTKAQRQVGKVQELACGYQGSVGAFQTMAKGYGVVIGDDKALEVVLAWRKAHPKIRAFWYQLNDEIKDCIRSPGKIRKFGKLVLGVKDRTLLIQLPSRRYLVYADPRIVTVKVKRVVKKEIDGKLVETLEFFDSEQVEYLGMDKGSWKRIRSYGGKFTENIVQAIARDLLAHAMRRADSIGLELVLTVHDEILIEDDESEGDALAWLTECMKHTPPWAAGLPIAVEGFTAKRYKKG